MTPYAIDTSEACRNKNAALPWSMVPFDASLASRSPSTGARVGITLCAACVDVEGRLSTEPITTAFMEPSGRYWVTYVSTTATGEAYVHSPLPNRDEVRRLRDEIARRTRLTQTQIARAAGVGRRSLASWVKGAAVPGPGRLERLRFLAALVREIDAVEPGRARVELLGPQDLLSQIAQGHYERAKDWRARLERPAIRIESSKLQGRGLHQAALDAFIAGRLAPLGRSRVLRSPEVYEQDLSKAERFEPDDSVPRRRGYR